MQLTKLEIKGFKSFGDKVVINFDQGITGIIGPNGCGKSNVVDAIRWVLGEQKVKSLRSEKMDNIIFNGTKTRKPTQLAEVSLSFKNTKNLLPTEYTNVTITRRYYRSGESEYQLNGITCRLKDITNLFLDTGIASNSYAIIELGMVDNILNDKDNSRRGLFEEAAGISKFKIRKKETLKKLTDTDSDLERVEDLLFEIEKNLKSLERQAKQAQKYYKIKEDYKSYSVHLAKSTLEEQKNKLEKLQEAIESANDKKISLNKQLAEKEVESEQAKTNLISSEKKLSSRQKTLNEHVNNIRQYESEKKIKNERTRYLNDRTDKLKEQLELDRKSSERASFSIVGLEKEKFSAEKSLSEIFNRLESFKKEFEEEKENNQILKLKSEELNVTFNDKKEEVYQITKSHEIKLIQISALKQELEQSTTDSTSRTENIQNFEKRISEIDLEKKHKQEEFQQLKTKDEQLKNRIVLAEKMVSLIREELHQINRKLDASQNEYNLTKSLVDNLEGFPEAIKFLKKETSWSQNAPLLSDILTCPEEYRITIENYLQSYMNYYIVDTEAEAFKAISILSESSRGKANFFILDRFDKFKPSQTQLIENSVSATEVVEYDSKYLRLIGYILDDVYITTYNDLEGATSQNGATLITKNGNTINKPFSLSGGSVGLFEGKRIGRAKNLEKLSVTIKGLKVKLESVKHNLESKTNDLDNLKEHSFGDELTNAQEELSQINEEYVSVTTKQEQFANLLSENLTKNEDILERISALSLEIEDLEPRKETEQKQLAELELKNKSFKEELLIYNEQLNTKSASFNQENILYHQQQNKVATIGQEIHHKETNFDSAKERIDKNQSELKQTEEEVRLLMEKADSNDDQLINMYEEKEAIEIGVNEIEKAYYAERELIELVEKDARTIQREREDADANIMEAQNQLNETKLQLTSVKERLSVEFNVDIDQLLINSQHNSIEDITSLTEEELNLTVARLKSKLDSIGPINPMAMEAYEEIQKRHDFITSQKNDLAKAKESLLQTIDEINEVAKVTFLEAFENIKVNFIKVFRSLFTEEDQCDLTLSNPDDPLESTIEIIAKPKGKRPLSINQLSGGEKTLTATSLLFAIYLLKPAPFCIFDEVDAPLDDANIDKFNNIIRDFADMSQFIIVTHNKRTMSATDIIYGITMIEQGVTRVVPVNLKELD